MSAVNSQTQSKLKEKNVFCVPLRFILAALVLLATVVLYICRINLSTAIVVMSNYNKSDSINGSDVCSSGDSNGSKSKQNEGEFNWNETTQGVILGAFFWGYILFQVVGGRLSEIFGAKWLCAGGIGMSIIVNLLTPLIARANYYLFLASRVVLGICQSVVFPSCYALFAKWVPDQERSTILSLPTIGGNIGSIATSAMAGFLAKHGFAGGWPSVFYVSAIIAFAWLLCWIIFAKSDPKDHPWISEQELEYIQSNIGSNNKSQEKSNRSVPWVKILTSMPVLSAYTVKFTINWSYILLLLKLPSYLQNVMKYPIDQNGLISSIVYVTLAISLFFGGFVADYLVGKRIINKTLLRKIFESIAGIGPAVCMVIIPLVECNKNLVVVLLVLAMIASGLQAGGDIPVFADMTNNYAATVFAIGNTIAMICGFLTPLVIGVILESSDQLRKQWSYVFYLSAAINVFGVIVFIIFGSAERQSWDKIEEDNSGSDPVVSKI